MFLKIIKRNGDLALIEVEGKQYYVVFDNNIVKKIVPVFIIDDFGSLGIRVTKNESIEMAKELNKLYAGKNEFFIYIKDSERLEQENKNL